MDTSQTKTKLAIIVAILAAVVFGYSGTNGIKKINFKLASVVDEEFCFAGGILSHLTIDLN